MVELIGTGQVYFNLRRSALKGKISLLSAEQINKHFKKFYYDEVQGKYFCPYTGVELTKENTVLEHIISISSGGGTVLFNCIPALKDINGADEKGARHLLDWWYNSEHFDENRLQTLIDYMISAYEEVLGEHNNVELLNSPSEIISEDNLKKENDKEEFSEETEIKLLKQAENVGELENLTFLNQCITLLSKYKDITAYKKKIEEMKNHQFFSNISEYEKYSQILQDLIKENIGEENREYLTISIKYCPRIPELVKSIQSTIKTDEEIKKEISRRLNIIANVLEENNITLYSYLCDIGNRSIPNVLANETPTKEEFEDLIKEIKISRKEKFSHLIAFVEDPKNIRNRMPSARAKNNREKELGIFVGNIRRVRAQKRYTLLDKEQLEYLSNSRIEGLNQIYRDILLDTTQNNIKLDYVD